MRITLRDGNSSLTLGPEIEAETPWFSARVPGLEQGDLRRLRTALQVLQDEGAGHVVFRSETATLELTFVLAKKGELHLSVKMQNAPDYLNEVRLFLNMRQEDLPKIVEQLES